MGIIIHKLGVPVLKIKIFETQVFKALHKNSHVVSVDDKSLPELVSSLMSEPVSELTLFDELSTFS